MSNAARETKTSTRVSVESARALAVLVAIDAGEPLVTEGVIGMVDGTASMRRQLGVAADGTIMRDFLAPPAAPAGIVGWDDAVPIEAPPLAARDLSVSYAVLEEGNPVWYGTAYASLGLPDALTIPPMPTGASLPRSASGQLVYGAAPLDVPGVTSLPLGSLASSRRFKVGE